MFIITCEIPYCDTKELKTRSAIAEIDDGPHGTHKHSLYNQKTSIFNRHTDLQTKSPIKTTTPRLKS